MSPTAPALALAPEPWAPAAAGRRDARLRHVVRAEWTKLAGLRSTWLTVALTLAVSIGLAALTANARGRLYADLDAADRAAFDPTQVTLVCADLLGVLCLAALGVLAVTSEYATGSIHGTLAAVPARGTVLAAKALLVAGVSLVTGELASFGSFLLGQPILAAHDGVPHASLADPDVLRAVAGSGVLLMLCSVLALAFGALTRATAGGLSLLTATTLIIPLVAGLLPDWLARWWPATAGSQITHVVPVDGAAPVWPGFALFAGSVAAVLLAAAVVLQRRDA